MTQRAEARIAGYAYLSYIVFAMSSSLLSAKTTAGDDASHTLATIARMIPTARVTVLLDLLQPLCAILLAATLYQLVKAVDPTLALIAMLFRLGEGLLASHPILDKLELIRLATTPPGSRSAFDLSLANELLQRSDRVLSELCFVAGGFLFAYLLLRGRLIPHWMAWTGVITIGAQLICVPLHIATIIPGSIVNWLWFPILLYEVPLGIWLIARGTKTPHLPPILAA